MHANRCISVNATAVSAGVQVGLRRREAQARCPGVHLHQRDEALEGRRFESVLAELEQIAAHLEVGEPGRVVIATRGPSRLHGGDRALATLVAERVVTALAAEFDEPDRCRVGVGIADGPASAMIAAAESVRSAEAGEPRSVVVPAGTTAGFLADLPIESLGAVRDVDPKEVGEQLGVLRRLGLRTIGRFAVLPTADVQGRFGALGAALHRLARGEESLGPVVKAPPVDLRVAIALDPPAERVEQVAFVAKGLAETLHSELSGRGLAATSVLVAATTDAGDRIERTWRAEGSLTPAAVAQRIRWQLEGWLDTGRSLHRCHGGVDHIEVVPQHVLPDRGVQQGFWGGTTAADERAAQALARVQALVGSGAVKVPEWRGGRAPAEQFQLLPLDAVDVSARKGRDSRPWPGAVPGPSPAQVWRSPRSVEVLDAQGRSVSVNGRGLISASPQRCHIGDAAGSRNIAAWAGPWCVDERWWDPVAHRRRARIQVLLAPPDDGSTRRGHPSAAAAHLLTLEDQRWWLEASYD